MNGLNVVYQQFIAMYDSGWQNCCNCPDWSRDFMCQHAGVPYRR